MKLALLKRKIQARYLRSGLLALAVCLLLALTSLAQADDTRIALSPPVVGIGLPKFT